ncbi:MAG: replication-relaxation family protein [Solirubrobacteraceae bacterium]
MTTPQRHAKARALSTVAVEVLESLHQHRLLTVRQIHALHTPSTRPRWTYRILAGLAERGLAERVAGPHRQGLWFLTAHGADTIQAAGTLAEPRRRITTPEQAAGPLRAHTLAVNDTGIAFVHAARKHDGDGCGPLSWRHEIAHPYIAGRGSNGTHLLIADALLSYLQAAPDESLILHQRFIELDRGTIPPDQLASKLARYAQLNHYSVAKDAPEGPLWRAYYRTFPPVLVVLADQTPAAARRRIQKTIALYRSDPSQGRYGTVPASFTTLPELTARGPFAPIFIPADKPDHYRDWLGNTHQHQPKGEHDVPA